MRRAGKFLAATLTGVTAVTVLMAGGPRGGVSSLRVADFAALLANYASTGPLVGAEEAAERLARLGVPLGDPGATLTEGRLTAIMGFYGIQAGSANPGSQVSAERGGAAAAILHATVLSRTGTEKKPTKPTPPPTQSTPPPPTGDDDLGVCLSERNRGQCVNCCKDMGQPANVCAHFCQNIEHPSPSQPR